jgi:hypothetical protein
MDKRCVVVKYLNTNQLGYKTDISTDLIDEGNLLGFFQFIEMKLISAFKTEAEFINVQFL